MNALKGAKWSQKLREFLESQEYDIRFNYINRETDAQIDHVKKEIIFNLPLFLASCLVHEFIHYKNGWDNPAGERKTRRLETRVIRDYLTDGQINELGWKVLRYSTKGGKYAKKSK